MPTVGLGGNEERPLPKSKLDPGEAACTVSLYTWHRTCNCAGAMHIDMAEPSPHRDHSAAENSAIREALLRVWRAPILNPLFRTVSTYVPTSLQRRLADERARVRNAELKQQLAARPRLVPEREFRSLVSRALCTLAERHGRESLGDYFEFGVYNGTSLTCMYRELADLDLSHVRLFGFDSFEGFPADAAAEDEGRWQPGRCCSPFDFTVAALREEGVDLSRVTLVPGWFSDTLCAETRRAHRIQKASVIMVDCDLYSSTKAVLEFCEPLIADEAVVIFDEWTISRFPDKILGEKKAFLEFLEQRQCFSAVPFGQYAPRSQAFLINRIG
jgi:O-methyltransferase